MFDVAFKLNEEKRCAIQTSFPTNSNWLYDWCE
jgi:hypothetical protein